jgi:hypothetical protein
VDIASASGIKDLGSNPTGVNCFNGKAKLFYIIDII